MRVLRVAVCPGDGIGPEVVQEAEKVLAVVEANQSDVKFEIVRGLVGGAAYDQHKNHLPSETLLLIGSCDALLFGSVGGPVDSFHLPKWKDAEKTALLGLRKHFDLGVNIRPAIIHNSISHLSPLKDSIVRAGADIVIVRELASGIYFGKRALLETSAYDTLAYSVDEIRRPLIFAFETARKREEAKRKVCVVDKANVLDTSRLWRRVASEVHKQYPEVELSFM